MKKITLTIFVFLILTLSACGISNAANPVSGPQGDSTAGGLPEATQLIIGTLKLEDTNQSVTAEQAAALLPLWQTMLVLSESDTAAQQETEALVTQIQETMTAEQRQAITDMNLTREDMLSIMQEQGLAMGGGQNTNRQGENPNGGGFGPGGSPDGAPPQGGFPGGGPGGGGPGGGQGSGLTPDQIATAQASRQAGGGNVVPPALVNALIDFLEQKAGS